MAGIIGYGEDALTLWALKNKLEEILEKLGDGACPSDCNVFYRPSFGRGGSSTANFGEFDAIISTRGRLCLVESKWGASNECRDGKVMIRDTQQRRHKIFEWYFYNWTCEKEWSSFVQNSGGSFSNEFPGKKLAPDGSILSSNLQEVLRYGTTRDGHKKSLKHILLFIHPPEANPPNSIEPDWFELVKVQYPAKTPKLYFDMI